MSSRAAPAATVTLEQERVASPPINADEGIGKRLRKVCRQPEDGVEVLAEEDATAIRPRSTAEVVERDAELRIVVSRGLHLCDGTIELCERLAANIGNTFPAEALVLFADQDRLFTLAQLARGE